MNPDDGVASQRSIVFLFRAITFENQPSPEFATEIGILKFTCTAAAIYAENNKQEV
ncbi:hypothetical protein [Paenibacillus aestuarii]|uniref:Uncharacterized protein n=1 Tax=Paenibacillus aestuarii TaxID=516965 RepID=A0ABW0KHA9_9BACL|nr:hypothetical protein [Paenibacillus aestuarii]